MAIFSGKKGRGEEYKYKSAEEIKKARLAAARARDKAYRQSRLDARKKLFSDYKNAINPDFDMTEKERNKIKGDFIASIYDLIDKETEDDFKGFYDSNGVADVIRQLEEDVEDVEYLTAKDFKVALKKDKEKGNAGRKGSLNFF